MPAASSWSSNGRVCCPIRSLFSVEESRSLQCELLECGDGCLAQVGYVCRVLSRVFRAGVFLPGVLVAFVASLLLTSGPDACCCCYLGLIPPLEGTLFCHMTLLLADGAALRLLPVSLLLCLSSVQGWLWLSGSSSALVALVGLVSSPSAWKGLPGVLLTSSLVASGVPGSVGLLLLVASSWEVSLLLLSPLEALISLLPSLLGWTGLPILTS